MQLRSIFIFLLDILAGVERNSKFKLEIFYWLEFDWMQDRPLWTVPVMRMQGMAVRALPGLSAVQCGTTCPSAGP